MRRITCLALVFVIFFPAAYTQTYIVNATVVDVEKQKLLPNRTVVIENGKIKAVEPASRLKVPVSATVIDGNGKFLMPGLTDAHVHFFQSGGLYTRPDAIDLRKYRSYETEIEWNHRHMADFLKRYTGIGITTVIDVGANFHFLKQRDSFANKSYAPAVYMTGPLLTTWEPQIYKGLKDEEPFLEMKTEEDARKFVQQQLPYKPDFIKIWYIVTDRDTEAGARKSLPLVKAVIDEAHKNNLRVAVHATERITAQLAVENGCDFLVHGIDDEIVKDDFVQLLRQKKVVLCPTLIVAHNYMEVFGQQYDLSLDDHKLANPFTLGSLFDLRHLKDTGLINRYERGIKSRAAVQIKTDSILYANTRKLADGGVIIATGTDAGNIGTLHVSSYYEELKAMSKAGLTPWQILQASTINGARAIGKEKDLGSIQPGKVADLLLLNASPLEDIGNIKKIDQIINKGNSLKPGTTFEETPEELVQRQVNAYNGHDLEAFLDPYSDDVEIYMFPNKAEMKGKEAMRKAYQFITQMPELHCEIQKRIIQGNTIIDHERVRTRGNRLVEAIAIYEIKNGKIRKVTFIE